jgi:hypothetical protein
MCQRILLDELNMHGVAAQFVPRPLSNDQKEYCIAVCTELKEQAEKDPNFVSTNNTGDESWVCGYSPETNQRSSQWKTRTSPQPKEAQQA